MKTQRVHIVLVASVMLALATGLYLAVRPPGPDVAQVEMDYSRPASQTDHELIDQRGPNSAVYAVGANLLAMHIAPHAIHYRETATGQWQRIDLTLRPSTHPDYLEMTQAEYQVRLRREITADTLREATASVTLLHYSARGAGVDFALEKQQSFGTLQPSRAEVMENRVVYRNILPGSDLVFVLEPERVIEELVVHDVQTARRLSDVRKRWTVRGATLQMRADGSVAFLGEADGGLLFTVPRPVLYERGGHAVSYGVHFQVERMPDGAYRVWKTLDATGRAWLADSGRMFPSILDDTVDLGDTTLTTGYGDGYVKTGGTSCAVTSPYTRVTDANPNPVGCLLGKVYRGFFEWDITSAAGAVDKIKALGMYLNGTKAYSSLRFVKLTAPLSTYTDPDLFTAIGDPNATVYTTPPLSVNHNYITLGFIPTEGVTACCRQAVDDFNTALGTLDLKFAVGVQATPESGYGAYISKDETTNVDTHPDLVVFYQAAFGSRILPERPLRNVIWDSNRWWLFYTANNTGTDSVDYAYSPDGTTWTYSNSIGDNATSRHHAVWYNRQDSTVYAAYHTHTPGAPNFAGDMKVKVGTINDATPSISFPTGGQIALDGIEISGNSGGYDFPSITKDVGGYCWVLGRYATAEANSTCAPPGQSVGYCYGVTLTRSTDTGCTTWLDATKYFTLTNPLSRKTEDSGDVLEPGGYVVPMGTDSRVYVVYKDLNESSSTPNTLRGRRCRYDTTAMAIVCDPFEVIASDTARGVYMWGMSVVAIGDVVHVMYVDPDYSLQYKNRSSSGTWSAATAIETASDTFSPGLSWDNDPGGTNNLYVFYRTDVDLSQSPPPPTPTPIPHSGSGCVYYRKGTGSGTLYTWDAQRTQVTCGAWAPVDGSTGYYPLFSTYSSRGGFDNDRRIMSLWVEGVYGLDWFSITP